MQLCGSECQKLKMLKVITSDTYRISRSGALRCLLFLSPRGGLITLSAGLA